MDYNRYSTTLGSTATLRDVVPSPILTRNSPHEWTEPFTEEVEDVKTVLRLLPLVICLSLSVSLLGVSPRVYLFKDDHQSFALNRAITNWLFPIILIPLYQLLLYRCFRICNPSMLLFVGVGLFLRTIGHILLSALGVVGVIVSGGVQAYLSCTARAHHATYPGNELEWYWKLDPIIFYGIGKTIITVLLYEFIIAQSPDKMKGLVMGILLACHGFVFLMTVVLFFLILVVLFVVFLLLSKCYTLRERNREINMQAIVEEHYERYMDQEEVYIRENPHYFESLESDSDDNNSDSD